MVPYGLLRAPYERTTSFLHGTALGAERVARDFDAIRGGEGCPAPQRTFTLTRDQCSGPGRMIRALAAEAGEMAAAGLLPVMLGGEHTCTLGPLTGLRRPGRDLGVVHLDAHADLRSFYQGSKYSHASVMRRVSEDCGIPHISIGIRAYSAGEARYLVEKGVGYIPGRLLHRWDRLLPPLLRRLPRRIYLTVDMDFFDPGAVPGVGTPEPGGADWYRGLEVVQAVLAEKILVGADIVELCPPQEGAVSVRAAARMLLLILEKSRSS